MKAWRWESREDRFGRRNIQCSVEVWKRETDAGTCLKTKKESSLKWFFFIEVINLVTDLSHHFWNYFFSFFNKKKQPSNNDRNRQTRHSSQGLWRKINSRCGKRGPTIHKMQLVRPLIFCSVYAHAILNRFFTHSFLLSNFLAIKLKCCRHKIFDPFPL